MDTTWRPVHTPDWSEPLLWLTHAPLLALALLFGAGAPPASPSASPASAAPRFVCTPTTLAIDGNQQKSRHPIAAALARARPGDVIDLRAGTYGAFTIGFNKDSPWNAKTSGGRPGQPITLRGVGKVRIRAGQGDTIAISQQMRPGHIVFENLEVMAGGRAGVMFYETKGAVHAGFKFYDCNIMGTWNHLTRKGGNSKWGLWGHNLKDFEFIGRSRPAQIRNIRHEHAFYILNPQGDVTIQNVHASRLGRTFCQFTARKGNGRPGVGNITVRDCVVEDVCIAAGDGYKGGSAFTVAGRLTGTILFENNTYKAGFRPELQRLTTKNVPYGTGAFVAWDGRDTPNGVLILRNNDFAMAEGCGDRPLVSLGGCREVRLEGHNRFAGGAFETALVVDPMGGGRPQNTPVGKLSVASTTTVEGGSVRYRGKKVALAELEAALVGSKR
jgi:hypothetical protein